MKIACKASYAWIQNHSLHYVLVVSLLVVGKMLIKSNREHESKEHKLTSQVWLLREKTFKIDMEVCLEGI